MTQGFAVAKTHTADFHESPNAVHDPRPSLSCSSNDHQPFPRFDSQHDDDESIVGVQQNKQTNRTGLKALMSKFKNSHPDGSVSGSSVNSLTMRSSKSSTASTQSSRFKQPPSRTSSVQQSVTRSLTGEGPNPRLVSHSAFSNYSQEGDRYRITGRNTPPSGTASHVDSIHCDHRHTSLGTTISVYDHERDLVSSPSKPVQSTCDISAADVEWDVTSSKPRGDFVLSQEDEEQPTVHEIKGDDLGSGVHDHQKDRERESAEAAKGIQPEVNVELSEVVHATVLGDWKTEESTETNIEHDGQSDVKVAREDVVDVVQEHDEDDALSSACGEEDLSSEPEVFEISVAREVKPMEVVRMRRLLNNSHDGCGVSTSSSIDDYQGRGGEEDSQWSRGRAVTVTAVDCGRVRDLSSSFSSTMTTTASTKIPACDHEHHRQLSQVFEEGKKTGGEMALDLQELEACRMRVLTGLDEFIRKLRGLEAREAEEEEEEEEEESEERGLDGKSTLIHRIPGEESEAGREEIRVKLVDLFCREIEVLQRGSKI